MQLLLARVLRMPVLRHAVEAATCTRTHRGFWGSMRRNEKHGKGSQSKAGLLKNQVVRAEVGILLVEAPGQIIQFLSRGSERPN